MPPYAAVLPRLGIDLGIDLAGVARNETGLALLRDGRLEDLSSAREDAEILAFIARAGPGAAVAINAPLAPPRGRCCLEDDCPCRHDPGTRSRQAERDLLRMGVPTLATGLLKVLARRGIRLAAALRAAGVEPLEAYPFATLKLLGLPAAGKRTPLGRRRIHDALRALVPSLDHPDASEHQLDAVVCAYTAHLWRLGGTRAIGAADEGLMIVPDVPSGASARAPALEPARRVAEAGAAYAASDELGEIRADPPREAREGHIRKPPDMSIRNTGGR